MRESYFLYYILQYCARLIPKHTTLFSVPNIDLQLIVSISQFFKFTISNLMATTRLIVKKKKKKKKLYRCCQNTRRQDFRKLRAPKGWGEARWGQATKACPLQDNLFHGRRRSSYYESMQEE